MEDYKLAHKYEEIKESFNDFIADNSNFNTLIIQVNACIMGALKAH
jgi:hypothetical protein